MPSMMNTALFGLLATAAKVAAHGFVDEITVDGTSFTGYLVNSYPYQATAPESIGWSETSTDLGFVSPSKFATGDIICHNGAKNAALSAPVKAGGKVDCHWNTWPESHHGPVINYMANCGGDCATVDKAALKWFKISESGLLDNTAAPGKWASDALMANNLTGSVTIPSSIAPGNYVLRHEMIALHSAGQADGAQNYPFCINLEVSGSGTDSPEGVLGTSLYTPTDPGILVSIYTAGLTYDIPGPALYAGGSGPAAPVATSAAAPVASSTSAPITTSVPEPSATSAPDASPVQSSTAAPVPTSAPVDDDDGEYCE
ncbi:putative endoglucanase [Rhexocercosporidium sp. MPI-PUGE-AT-0058]|nr:putative endoglucanase [Rhexocercosporidium sp. MPI-PUGE-AT-0058]